MQVTLLSTSVVDRGFAVLVWERESAFGWGFVLDLLNLWVQEWLLQLLMGLFGGFVKA
jgi:hypothetical protein